MRRRRRLVVERPRARRAPVRDHLYILARGRQREPPVVLERLPDRRAALRSAAQDDKLVLDVLGADEKRVAAPDGVDGLGRRHAQRPLRPPVAKLLRAAAHDERVAPLSLCADLNAGAHEEAAAIGGILLARRLGEGAEVRAERAVCTEHFNTRGRVTR